MAKERREYRDNTEEYMLNMNLLGAVIKQAYEDVRDFKYNEDNLKDYGFKSGEAINRLQGNYNASKDACKFFESKRLERFISAWRLPLEAGYLRRKYKELRKELK